MIERVEVVKGPQSTLYGSEAMGGVVNVVTRSPQVRAWRFDASATRGERGRDEARVGASGSAGDRVALLADAGRRVAELVPGRPDEAAARTTRWDGLVRLGWQATDSLSLDVSGLALDESQRYRTGQLHSFVDNLQGSGHVRAAWRHGPHRLTPALYATAFEHRSATSTSDEPPASGAERELQRLAEAELLYSVRLGAQTLDVGVEARRESIRSDRVQGRRRDISTLESFLQATVTAGPVTLVPGLRASFSDPWGRHWTPRVAALLRPRPDLALRASVGQGFRAPDFKELHMEFLNLGPGFGYTVRGNPDLLPESSRNVTAGVTWTGERAYVHLQGFDNRFDRFIETRAVGDSAGVTVYTYGNIDDGFTRGLEVEAGLTWAAWRLEGSYGALQAEHGDAGEPLLGRPTSSARGTLGWVHPSGLRLSFAGVYTGTTAMQRTEAGETLHRDPFLRFDARASRALPGNLDLIIGADNLFDARSAEWPGFTGRQLYVTVAWVSGGRGG
jgi:outer membrane receptor for ferrienterochelin and colicins